MDPHVTLVSFSDKIGGDSFSIELDPAVFINQDFLAQQKLPLEFKGGNGVPTKEFIDSLFIEQDQLSSKTTDLVSKLIKPIANEASRQNGPTTSSSNYISSPATAPSPPVAGKTLQFLITHILFIDLLFGGTYGHFHLLFVNNVNFYVH